MFLGKNNFAKNACVSMFTTAPPNGVKLFKLGWYRYSYALNRLRGEGCFSIDLSVLKFLLRSANHILALLGALSKEKTYGNAVWILFSLRRAVPFAKVRTNIGRRYLNSGKSKFLSIMCFRGFRVWYYDLNFIFCRILRHFAVDGSQVTHKRNNEYRSGFQIVVRRSLCFALRAFVGTVFKRLVFFRWGGAPIVATRRLQ